MPERSREGSPIQTTNFQTLTLGGGSTGDIILGRSSQSISLPSYSNCTLKTSAGILTCGTDLLGAGASDNFWQYNSTTGIVANGNLTTDFLLGSTSTSSARFGVINVSGGTPTATLSAGIAGGAYITANGTIATTNKQSLTLGSASTGNIVLSGFGTGIVKSDANGVLTSSAVNLASTDVTGILPLANGGTGLNINSGTIADGQILIGNDTATLSDLKYVAGHDSLINQRITPPFSAHGQKRVAPVLGDQKGS